MGIVVVGANGKMGEKVCFLLKKAGEHVFRLDKSDKIKCKDAELIIDFSTSDDRTEIVKYAESKKIPYACFSTGMSEHDNKLLQELARKVPVLMCKNSSRGMSVMMESAKIAAQRLSSADIVLQEYHHKDKKDSPSGTAKQLLEIMHRDGICVQSCRVGNEIGTHKIQFFLEDEIFEISHRASSRDVFAKGAIEMANRLKCAKIGMYSTI